MTESLVNAKSVPLPGSGMTEVVPKTVEGSYEILGADLQILNLQTPASMQLELASQPGAMMMMSENMQMETNCNNCFGRCLSGESCILVTYRNNGSVDGFLGLTPTIPAKIVPLEVKDGELTYRSKSGAWFSSLGGVKLGYDLDCNPATCCFAGQGCIRQTLTGNGTAFVAAMGTLLTKELGTGEKLIIDTNSLVAWQDTVKLDIRANGGCCTCCCAGEGLFSTVLEGPGVIYVQSMSVEKFRTALRTASAGGGRNKGGSGGGAPLLAEEMHR